ncbi:transposase InsO family protein [Nocardioides daedukensis]|uniref:Transposase InsO family protein n=1 Tax=Nocardioides daedukensis TaxID=634462 RepID=A0A7Y9UTW6_9ACTN|nr:integrase [Nocardioides daedukensis]NYG59354.1 transposase InsO family protein [Nocardioides daedukensis]
MSGLNLKLQVGSRLLNEDGYLLVTEMGRHSVTVETSTGAKREVPYGQIIGSPVEGGCAGPNLATLEPWWSGLPEEVRRDALVKLEVVQEILTGYRWAHRRLAQPAEPDPTVSDPDLSETQRCEAMARQLSYERSSDRKVLTRVQNGELRSTAVGASTVQKWIRDWRDHGLRGLVDKRAVKGRQGYDALDERVRRIADDAFARFDGDVSKVNTTTIEAAIRLQMKAEGIGDLRVPERLLQEYLSERQRALGRTTRAQRSRHLRRKASAHTSFPAMHPSHIAIDATRADVLVWDELRKRPVSVEILTAISVATRVVVGLRVTPRSGNALEAGLLLYDVMRPMSMLVEGTEVDDWRWCGVPESLDLANVPVHRSPKRIVPPGQSLQGVHVKPGVRPSSIRCDHGSVFLSEHFIGLLRDFGIDLMLSRGSKPTDNPHVERWHETLQRAYQAIPGFKGRNVAERGRKVDATGEALLTASELERHLRRFVALDYHRSWHEGLVLPGAPSARLTPLEMWDAMHEVTGRLHVPQHPDLIYQFLPIRWLTIGHAGVEYKNLVYDDPVLTDFRDVRKGTFQADSRKAPFHYDPRDVSRIWFRHPETGRIHEIGWKARHLLDMPMGDWMHERALERIAERGGNTALSRKSTWRQIITELGKLTSPEETAEARAKGYAARLRWEQAQRDHAEAAEAAAMFDGDQDGVVTPLRPRRPATDDGFDLDAEWPDYDEGGD